MLNCFKLEFDEQLPLQCSECAILKTTERDRKN